MYEKQKNTTTVLHLEQYDDSRIREYELAMSCTGECGAIYWRCNYRF
jgi:hypothetical protein